MASMDPSRVLFVGYGRSIVSFYRAALPALYMGADWIGVDDNINKACGVHKHPNPLEFDYDLVIWQQPRIESHFNVIRDLRSRGVKVLIEVDDYLHGVRRMKDHDFKDSQVFTKKALEGFVRQMGLADGLIVSTDFLKQKYGRHARQTWVCKNGLDLGRYEKTKSSHSMVNIGWSGATGHVFSFQKIAGVIHEMLSKYPNTTFISIGQPFAAEWAQEFPDRILMLPFCSLEVYPNAMSMFDIALAPARDSGWYRAKSALRFYESAALGTPVIGTTVVYGDEIRHGVDGLIADSEDEWRNALETLITDETYRREMGYEARNRAFEEFDMNHRVEQWKTAITQALS